MRSILVSVLAIGLATPAGAATPAAWQKTMPTRFIGKWAVDAAACRDPEATSTKVIKAAEIADYEVVLTVKRARMTGPDTVAFQGVVDTEEGSQPGNGTLTLSPDGRRLLRAGVPVAYSKPMRDLIRC